MTPQNISPEILQQSPLLFSIILLFALRTIFIDIYKMVKSKKEPTSEPVRDHCSTHSEILISNAVILEKLTAIHAWTIKHDLTVEKITKKLGQLDLRVGLIETQNGVKCVIDDDTRG